MDPIVTTAANRQLFSIDGTHDSVEAIRNGLVPFTQRPYVVHFYTMWVAAYRTGTAQTAAGEPPRLSHQYIDI